MQIRFCRSFDQARLAYAISGKGPALVKAPHWFTHLEHEPQSPIWRPWIDALSQGRTLLRMDERASGLSDWDVADISFDAVVRDVEAVVDAAGLGQFALFGHSAGGAAAIAYAARHPDRVSHLVLLGAYARGWLRRGLGRQVEEELEARTKLIEVGLQREDPSYRQMFASQYLPGASLEELRWMSELLRRWTSPENAVRLMRCHYGVDVSEAAAAVRCPTLVFHARGDLRVPFQEGCHVSSLIPGSRFIALDSRNHIMLGREPVFSHFLAELRTFLPRSGGTAGTASVVGLTSREAEILNLMARGLGNAEIAAQLDVSEKTVRNNVTHIFDKLGVKTRSQAIVLARESGLGEC